MRGPLHKLGQGIYARMEEKHAQIGLGFKAPVNAELRGAFDETGKEFLSVPDEDRNGDRHAPLASSTKCSTSNRVQGVVDIS